MFPYLVSGSFKVVVFETKWINHEITVCFLPSTSYKLEFLGGLKSQFIFHYPTKRRDFTFYICTAVFASWFMVGLGMFLFEKCYNGKDEIILQQSQSLTILMKYSVYTWVNRCDIFSFVHSIFFSTPVNPCNTLAVNYSECINKLWPDIHFKFP